MWFSAVSSNLDMTWLNADILKHCNFHAVIVWLQFHVQGQRWYQKEFFHEMTFDLTTHKQAPEVCFDLRPGTNYSVNISMVAFNFSLLVSMTTQITGRSCHLFYVFRKACIGFKKLKWNSIADLSVVWWVVKVLFPCSKLLIVFCFHRFHRVDSPAAERERNGGTVFWSVILAQQGKDSLVG